MCTKRVICHPSFLCGETHGLLSVIIQWSAKRLTRKKRLLYECVHLIGLIFNAAYFHTRLYNGLVAVLQKSWFWGHAPRRVTQT